MIQVPNSVGLVLCEKFVVEQNTANLTLVNCFQRLAIEELPWTADPFYVYFCLTDGIGSGKLLVEIADLATLGNIQEARFSLQFDDPIVQLKHVLPVTGCTFERSGPHQITLSVDGEPIAGAVFDVELAEE